MTGEQCEQIVKRIQDNNWKILADKIKKSIDKGTFCLTKKQMEVVP
jgi:hypothetical protein